MHSQTTKRLFIIPVLLIGLTIWLLTNLPTTAHAAACNSMGRTQNLGGGYTFAQLHLSASGLLVDTHGCRILLLGAQGKGPNPTLNDQYHVNNLGSANLAFLAATNQAVQMNELRVPISVSNWNANPPMSNANNVLFQDFVKTYFKAIENQGDYIQIDVYEDVETTTLQDQIKALTSMAKTFVNDPAVLFDVRNESLSKSETRQSGLADDNAWLNAVQSVSPNIVKIIYVNFLSDMMNGAPFYTQSNLLLDGHLYSGFSGISPDTGQDCGHEPNPDWANYINNRWPSIETYLRAHGSNHIINEWGGCYDVPAYNDAIASAVLQETMAGMSYFEPTNWFYKGQTDGDAHRVDASYRNMFAQASGSGGTPPPSPSPPPPSPNPSPNPNPSPPPNPSSNNGNGSSGSSNQQTKGSSTTANGLQTLFGVTPTPALRSNPAYRMLARLTTVELIVALVAAVAVLGSAGYLYVSGYHLIVLGIVRKTYYDLTYKLGHLFSRH